jgi:hypothetical protein
LRRFFSAGPGTSENDVVTKSDEILEVVFTSRKVNDASVLISQNFLRCGESPIPIFPLAIDRADVDGLIPFQGPGSRKARGGRIVARNLGDEARIRSDNPDSGGQCRTMEEASAAILVGGQGSTVHDPLPAGQSHFPPRRSSSRAIEWLILEGRYFCEEGGGLRGVAGVVAFSQSGAQGLNLLAPDDGAQNEVGGILGEPAGFQDGHGESILHFERLLISEIALINQQSEVRNC